VTDYGARQARLLELLAPAGVELAALVPGPNMLYLTGLEFHLSERPVLGLLRAGRPVRFVVPALEELKLEAAAFPVEADAYTDEAGPARALAGALAAVGAGGTRCAVEERRLRFLEMDIMAHSGHPPALWGADAVFGELRECKDHEEVARTRRAVAIAEAAYGAVLGSLRAGLTEREVAARLTMALLDGGSDPDLPFFPIVAAGPNGAQPHAVPGDRPLEAGDFVVIDWGARHRGYVSDITRTAVVAGAAPPEAMVAAHEVVVRANAAGRAAARPGVTGRDVDAAARAVVASAGLGELFLHRTGHGIGLETHEDPEMKAGNLAPLRAGATFTVEPGVYRAGLGGVRIEDDVLVTAGGAETLTTLPRELAAIG
jgi:Xaa-Pro dipeptidase